MKKCILFIVCLFLLTGCNVTYNLEIGKDGYDESTTILESYDGDNSARNYGLYELYFEKPIPLSKNSPIQSQSNNELEGISYYAKEDLADDENFGFLASGTFGGRIPLGESNVISYGVGDIEFSEDDSNISINVPSNFKIFEQFPTLDNLTVNIKTKFSVNSNNADTVSGNTYTWNITRDNFKEKTIVMEISKPITGEKVSKNVKDFFGDFGTKELAIILAVVIVLGLIIYFYVSAKSKKANDF